MSDHGFNGTFQYSPDYEATEEDYEVAKDIFGGMGTRVTHISPIVDMELDGNRAVLFSVNRTAEGSRSVRNSQMVLYFDDLGRRLYRSPEKPVPESQEEFAQSFKDWTANSEGPQKRSNMWDAVKRLSNKGEEYAYRVRHDTDLIDIVDERDLENGMVEWEVEVDQIFKKMVAAHYDVDADAVGEQMISDFIRVALQDQLAKSNV